MGSGSGADGSGWRAVAYVARRDVRRRAMRLVMLAVLVGVVGATVLTVTAGARRTGTALERFQRTSRSADVEFAVGRPSDVRRIAGVPGVAAAAGLTAYGVYLPAVPEFQSTGTPIDDHFGRTIDRGRLIAGRFAAPDRPLEVTMGEGLAATLGVSVGDRVPAVTYTPPQVNAILDGTARPGEPAGPRLRLRVVGIVRRPLDLGDRASLGGLMIMSPSFATAYGPQLGVFGLRVRVRVEPGADVNGVTAAVQRSLGEAVFVAQPLAVESQGARTAISALAFALWLVAVVAAAAGLAAILSVLAREAGLVETEHAPMRDLGATRTLRTASVLPAAATVAIGGAALSALGAVVASGLLPIGVARRAEPDPGMHADWRVLGVGVAAIVLTVFGASAWFAWRATRRRADRTGSEATRGVRPGLIPFASARPSAAIGLRLGFARGSGRSPRPALRAATVAAVAAVVGFVAALVVGANLDGLVDRAPAWGESWDVRVVDVTPNTPCGGSDFGLTRMPSLIAVAEICTQQTRLDGRAVPAMAYRPLRGRSLGPTIVAGREPRTSHEVALGSTTLEKAGKRIGDVVRLSGRRSSRRYRIVGRAVFPTLAQAAPLADGVALTGRGYAPVFDPNLFIRVFVARYAPGTDRRSVEQRIAARPELGIPSRPAPPAEIARLRQIDALPFVLAGAVMLLAIVVIAHGLVVTVRRRRRDLAALKALGLTRSGARAAVRWQATAIGIVGLVVGIPIGMIAGVQTWDAIARGLGVAVVTAVPVATILFVVPAVLLVLTAVAVAPGVIAARTPTARVLRDE